jgi:dipeptide/tripeptide permease
VYILVGIPVLTIFVYKYLDASNRTLSIKVKLVIGMILASLTMSIAGTVEAIRQGYCVSGIVFHVYIDYLYIFILYSFRKNQFELEYICSITAIYMHGSR